MDEGGDCVESIRNGRTVKDRPPGTIDDVLTFAHLAVVVSGGDFKADCPKWWTKALRLAEVLGLDREEDDGSYDYQAVDTNPSYKLSIAGVEAKEERRRAFWLLYCVDRHLALSYNSTVNITEASCYVFEPLPEDMWQNLESNIVAARSRRHYGPSKKITGVGFFEYFLPLMVILGDVIEIHHRRCHPRFGRLDDTLAVSETELMLEQCEASLKDFENEPSVIGTNSLQMSAYPQHELSTETSLFHPDTAKPFSASSVSTNQQNSVRTQLIAAYSTHILHVLHVLLHGKWDPICMLEDNEGWITSPSFMKCSSHAVAASQAVSKILKFDPELTFMPYLFGIYLLHGSFILLLFADRMSLLGANESVEEACETIIRAHEVCVVTLNTEYQVRSLSCTRPFLP